MTPLTKKSQSNFIVFPTDLPTTRKCVLDSKNHINCQFAALAFQIVFRDQAWWRRQRLVSQMDRPDGLDVLNRSRLTWILRPHPQGLLRDLRSERLHRLRQSILGVCRSR